MRRQEMQLQEIYENLYDGPHATPKPADTGPVFLGIKNITEDGRLDLTSIRHISEKEYPKWTKRVTPQEGDIVFSYEATLHRYAIIPKGFRGCLGRRMALIRPDTKKVNAKYLFYYFFGSDWREEVSKYILTGATVDRIPLTKTPEFLIKLPPKEQQDEIAEFIDGYTRLIENNNRRIAILEQMAQTLYREWFINYRFPGHENTKLTNSPLGKIPEGWEVKRLSEIINIDRGRSYRSSELVAEGGYSFLNLKNVAREGGFRRDGLKRYNGSFKPHQVAKPNDIIMAVTDMTQERAIIARPARVPNMGIEEFIISMDLVKITVKDGYGESFIYSLLRYSDFPHVVKQFANGANVLHLSPKVIEEYEAIIPSASSRSAFKEIIEPIHQIQDKIERKNDNLKKQRDMLLPKLISGSIEFKN